MLPSRMTQSQDSVTEQLARLRILAIDQEWDYDNLTPDNYRAMIRLANMAGLYEASDYYRNLMENLPKNA